jgi:hypothetical protein
MLARGVVPQMLAINARPDDFVEEPTSLFESSFPIEPPASSAAAAWQFLRTILVVNGLDPDELRCLQ